MRRYTTFYISIIILGDQIWAVALQFDICVLDSLLPCVILLGKGKMSKRVTCQCVVVLFAVCCCVHFVPEDACCYESKLLHLQSISGPCSYLPVLKFFEQSEKHIHIPYYFKVHEWSLGCLHDQILVWINLRLHELHWSVVFIWKMMQLGGFWGSVAFWKELQSCSLNSHGSFLADLLLRFVQRSNKAACKS